MIPSPVLLRLITPLAVIPSALLIDVLLVDISIVELVASVTAVTKPPDVSLRLILSPPTLVIFSLPSLVPIACRSPIEALLMAVITSDNSSAADRSKLVPFKEKICAVYQH
jgi:hypothetical protein